MKRGFLVLALAAFVAGGVFAQAPVQFSFGGGFSFDGGRLGGVLYEWSGSGAGWSSSESELHFVNHQGFGGHIFFDATFVELSIGLMGGPAHWGMHEEVEWTENGDSGSGVWREYDSGRFLALDFSLLGRLPIAIGDGNVSVFPLLGIGYNIVLRSRTLDGEDMFEYTNDHSASSLSTFRLQFGIGGDFDITSNVFFRLSILGNYRFAPSLFRDWADDWDGDHRGGFGGSMRMGIGFRF